MLLRRVRAISLGTNHQIRNEGMERNGAVHEDQHVCQP